MSTFSDVSRCRGTFLFFSFFLGRSFHFSGIAPFLKVTPPPPLAAIRNSGLSPTFSPHGFPKVDEAFHPLKM